MSIIYTVNSGWKGPLLSKKKGFRTKQMCRSLVVTLKWREGRRSCTLLSCWQESPVNRLVGISTSKQLNYNNNPEALCGCWALLQHRDSSPGAITWIVTYYTTPPRGSTSVLLCWARRTSCYEGLVREAMRFFNLTPRTYRQGRYWQEILKSADAYIFEYFARRGGEMRYS